MDSLKTKARMIPVSRYMFCPAAKMHTSSDNWATVSVVLSY